MRSVPIILGVIMLGLHPGPARSQESAVSDLLKSLEKGLDKRPLEEQTLYLSCLFQSGQYTQGLDFYDKAFAKQKPDTKRKPDLATVVLYYRLAKAAGDTARSSDALGQLSTQMGKRNALVLCELGIDASARGEFSGMGEGFFRKAIEIDPLYAKSYIELAARTKDREEAIRLLAQALSLVEPDSEAAKRILQLLARNKVPPGPK